MTSQRIFSVSSFAKNINSLSSPDPVSAIFVRQQWKHCSATVYANYGHE